MTGVKSEKVTRLNDGTSLTYEVITVRKGVYSIAVNGEVLGSVSRQGGGLKFWFWWEPGGQRPNGAFDTRKDAVLDLIAKRYKRESD
jgi:hypothetical protein